MSNVEKFLKPLPRMNRIPFTATEEDTCNICKGLIKKGDRCAVDAEKGEIRCPKCAYKIER